MHPCNLDEKKGLVLPKSLLDQMGESDVVFLTPGADQSLWLTTVGGLEKLTDKLEKKTDSEEDGKVSRRHYFALTQRAAMDKAGRLVIPAALAAGADLKREIVLIGVGDHVELWDAPRWHKYCQAAETDSVMSEGR
jgi:MraZ protein